MFNRSIEKSAVLHVLVKMSAKDQFILNSEKTIIEGMIYQMDMDEEDVEEAHDMSDGQAERILAGLSQNEKRIVSAALGSLIMIDGEADYLETAYYSNLCVRCGLPRLGPSQAMDILESFID